MVSSSFKTIFFLTFLFSVGGSEKSKGSREKSRFISASKVWDIWLYSVAPSYNRRTEWKKKANLLQLWNFRFRFYMVHVNFFLSARLASASTSRDLNFPTCAFSNPWRISQGFCGHLTIPKIPTSTYRSKTFSSLFKVDSYYRGSLPYAMFH